MIKSYINLEPGGQLSTETTLSHLIFNMETRGSILSSKLQRP